MSEHTSDDPPVRAFPPEIVCTLIVGAMLDDVEVDICCQRIGGVDRLFSKSMDWLKADRPSEFALVDSVVAMMPVIIKQCLKYVGKPVDVRAGLLTKEGVEVIIRKTLEEADATRNGNEVSEESPIVNKAKLLRLGPEASSFTQGIWSARCPETNHTLQLQSKTNLFSCGYCKVGGGPDKLQEFADRRRKPVVEGFR